MKSIKLLFVLSIFIFSSCAHEDLGENSFQDESVLEKRLNEEIKKFELYKTSDRLGQPSSTLLLTKEQYFNLHENSISRLEFYEGNENVFYVVGPGDDDDDPFDDCDRQINNWKNSNHYRRLQNYANLYCFDIYICVPCIDDNGNHIVYYLFHFRPNNGCRSDDEEDDNWSVD